LLDSLNPRKHISASIGWSVFIIIALCAPLCAWLVVKETENYIRRSATQSLQQNATQIHREISSNIDSRLSLLRLIGTHLSELAHGLPDVKLTLDGIQDLYPEINLGKMLQINRGLLMDQKALISVMYAMQKHCKTCYRAGRTPAPFE